MLTFSSLGNSQLLITVTFHIFRTVHDLVRIDDDAKSVLPSLAFAVRKLIVHV
jgi:hypothetical protein